MLGRGLARAKVHALFLSETSVITHVLANTVVRIIKMLLGMAHVLEPRHARQLPQQYSQKGCYSLLGTMEFR